ncbi:MAG: aldo/keto reductase [Anaerolineae bacterium]|nr:aldo/keto reductase [Anaerolineae bacterium]
MNTRILGRAGIEVTQLGLGGLFVSAFGGDYAQGCAAIRRALELGIRYIDTAPTYANSEEVIGRALEGVDVPVVLSTKLGGRPQPFRPQDRACLLRSVEESLRLLRRDHIDILMIHEPDRPGQYDWWTDPVDYHGPVLELLDDLKRDGVIRATGLGGTTAYEIVPIMRTGRFDVVLTAFNYSLLWREAEIELLPTARELGMGVIVGSPLQQGALARRYDEEVRSGARWLSLPRRKQFRALYDLLDEAGLPIAEAALRFAISNPDVSCVLTGARSAGEVESSVAAIEKGPLPADVLSRLDEIAAMVPFRPFEEPFVLPFGRPYRGPGEAR